MKTWHVKKLDNYANKHDLERTSLWFAAFRLIFCGYRQYSAFQKYLLDMCFSVGNNQAETETELQPPLINIIIISVSALCFYCPLTACQTDNSVVFMTVLEAFVAAAAAAAVRLGARPLVCRTTRETSGGISQPQHSRIKPACVPLSGSRGYIPPQLN